jgi:hypothetical protein
MNNVDQVVNRSRVASSNKSARSWRFMHVAILFLIPAAPMIFLGYGSDNDTYGVLDAGIETWVDGSPGMSRHPGYWLYEGLVFALDKLGGSLLINLSTIALSLLILHRFWVICEKLELRWRLPIVLALAWNPWYLIASTSAIDYLWSLLFIVLSIEAMIARRPTVAGVLGGIAAAFRLAGVFTIAGAAALYFARCVSTERFRQVVVMMCICAIISIASLVPSWIISNKSFSFFAPHLGDAALWTPKMYIGRIIYKPIYLCGLLATLSLVTILFLNRDRILGVLRDRRDLVVAAIGATIGTVLLFVKYPIEHSYLLPALPFLLILLGLVIDRAPSWQPWLFVAALVSFWFVSFPLATPDERRYATDATIGLKVERGALLMDVRERLTLMGCRTLACYDERKGVVTDRKKH